MKKLNGWENAFHSDDPRWASSPVGSDYLTGGIVGPEGSVLCTLVLIFGITYQLLRARRADERGPTKEDERASEDA
jgi:hypothetical protein